MIDLRVSYILQAYRNDIAHLLPTLLRLIRGAYQARALAESGTIAVDSAPYLTYLALQQGMQQGYDFSITSIRRRIDNNTITADELRRGILYLAVS